ncbi:MAG TPA: Mur ligase domain-containing protein, partial [Chitinophagaceae bacterium]|nr:Mur ligase domain-containing protein [Chitinophagaceae bacterium]
MSIEELYQIFKQYPSVNTNSKKIVQGDIFWALQGENFDGNHFVEDALANGAAYAVIDNPASQIPGKTILVKDSLQALHDLAKYHRQQLNIPVIAITGSNG